jgi:transposase-like protein
MTAALPAYEHTSVKGRSSTWHVRIMAGLACPICDRIMHAHDAQQSDRKGHRLRFVCAGCHRDLIELEHKERADD